MLERFKNHIIVGLFTLFAIFSLFGCATKPIPNELAKPIPINQIKNKEFLIKKPNTGMVTIKRDSGFTGSGCSSGVFVDGKKIADLKVSEKIVLFLPVGEHIISAWPNGICGGGMSEVKTNVKNNSSSNFRIGYGSNGDFSINPTYF